MRIVFLLLLLFPLAAHGQVFYTQSDVASNYTTATWVHESNLGAGFGAWDFQAEEGETFIVDPSVHSSGAVLDMPNPSFGRASQTNFPSFTGRVFSPLSIGETISFEWAVILDNAGGVKGINVYSGGISGGNFIELKVVGESTSLDGDVLESSSVNKKMEVLITQIDLTNVSISISSRANGSSIIRQVNLGGSVDALDFVVEDGGVMYFNNLRIRRIVNDLNLVPDNSDVEIDGVSPSISQPKSFRSLTLKNGAGVFAPSDVGLTVIGDYNLPNITAFDSGITLNLSPSRTTSQISGSSAVSGWRMVGPPVRDMQVQHLAGINLVQGVPGMPYSAAGSNVFTYGADGFTPVSAPTQDLPLGMGMLWYMYGPQVSAAGNDWKALPATLSRLGPVLTTDFWEMSDVPGHAEGDFEHYFLANPYPVSYCMSELYDNTGGNYVDILGYSIWNPTGPPTSENRAGVGTWETRTHLQHVEPWQGFFIALEPGDGVADFMFEFTNQSQCSSPGKTQSELLRADFELTGLIAGSEIVDRAASLVFDEAAGEGTRLHHVPKMAPLMTNYVTVALGGEGSGTNGFAMRGVPFPHEAPLSLPLRIRSTVEGTFALNLAALQDLPESYGLALTDLQTGERYNLRTTPVVTFATGIVHADRFLLTIDPAGTTTSVEGHENPTAFVLSAAAPNPFRSSTSLTLRVESPQTVSATLYDVIGREVAHLFHGAMAPAQPTTLDVRGEALAPGVYVLRVSGDTFSTTLRLVRIP